MEHLLSPAMLPDLNIQLVEATTRQRSNCKLCPWFGMVSRPISMSGISRSKYLASSNCVLKYIKGYESICKYMGVSKNSGTPKSSILIGFSIINHPFWGTPIFGKTHSQIWELLSLQDFKSELVGQIGMSARHATQWSCQFSVCCLFMWKKNARKPDDMQWHASEPSAHNIFPGTV